MRKYGKREKVRKQKIEEVEWVRKGQKKREDEKRE